MAVRGASFVTQGWIDSDTAPYTVSFFGGDRKLKWHVRADSFIASDVAFDAANNIWLAGVTLGLKRFGKARFPTAPTIPEHVKKAPGDVPMPPPPKGHIRRFPDTLQSLFGKVVHRVRMRGGRRMAPETIVDGVVLRYSPAGELTLVKYYPVGAIGWLSHLIPEGDGMTLVAFIEGRVPDAFRGHPDLTDGFIGVTLLVHFDGRGNVAWAEPLGKGERVVIHIVRAPDGYVVLSLNEQYRCELATWVVSGGAGQ